MFHSSVRSVLVALCLAAVVSAKAGLSLKVTGPESASGVEQLKVVTTLVNTGDVSLKLLNDPRGALSTLPTHTFTIEDAEGQTPAFTGMKVKYVPEVVIANNDEKAFTVLSPGQSVKLTHDLSKAYNFTRSGEGSYSIEASNLFYYIDPLTSQPVAIRADAEAHSAKLTGKLAVARASNLQKRIAYNGCTSSEQSLVSTAASNAITYATNALAYLKANTASTTRYVTWFGTFTTARHTTVQTHYQNMVNNAYTGYTYDCTCNEAGVYAYVFPDQWGYIYLCPVFWQAPTTGTDSKAGTIVHESSHFTNIGSTDDHAYGQTACKSLARSSPAQAVDNADSHEYFAENNPAQS